MTDRKQQIEAFFDRYATRTNDAIHGGNPDIEGTLNSFAECFVEASPMGVNCGKNDEQFRSMIPKGYAFYKAIGITSMNIISKEISLLDDLHAMVKVHWGSGFKRKNNSTGSIEFDVIYFVQWRAEGLKIFAYITGPEQKAFKELGLF